LRWFLNKTGIVKVTIMLLDSLAILLPIALALNQYGQNIHKLFTPSYEPPKIDISPGRFLGFRIEDRNLYATFEFMNRGEVKVIFESLNAMVYTSKGTPVASASLSRRISLEPGGVENVTFKLAFNTTVWDALTPLLLDENSVELKVNGTLTLGILGSKVIIPVSLPLAISRFELELAG
jgi:hypothetical protein